MQLSVLPAGLAVQPTDSRQPSKVGKAASEFEGLLIAQMLRSVREASSSESDDGDGAETNSPVMELGEQQFAQALANNGGLGIAKMVVAGLNKNANQ